MARLHLDSSNITNDLYTIPVAIHKRDIGLTLFIACVFQNKFSSLALAFKTDRLTLQDRLDVQKRHRDQAEYNLELETQRFRDQLMVSKSKVLWRVSSVLWWSLVSMCLVAVISVRLL